LTGGLQGDADGNVRIGAKHGMQRGAHSDAALPLAGPATGTETPHRLMIETVAVQKTTSMSNPLAQPEPEYAFDQWVTW
jgi:hypothetical protein